MKKIKLVIYLREPNRFPPDDIGWRRYDTFLLSKDSPISVRHYLTQSLYGPFPFTVEYLSRALSTVEDIVNGIMPESAALLFNNIISFKSSEPMFRRAFYRGFYDIQWLLTLILKGQKERILCLYTREDSPPHKIILDDEGLQNET